jgi:hypothetical protein
MQWHHVERQCTENLLACFLVRGGFEQLTKRLIFIVEIPDYARRETLCPSRPWR